MTHYYYAAFPSGNYHWCKRTLDEELRDRGVMHMIVQTSVGKGHAQRIYIIPETEFPKLPIDESGTTYLGTDDSGFPLHFMTEKFFNEAIHFKI